MARPRIEVNLDELDQVREEARQAPLSEDDYQKLKTARHALAEWARSRSTRRPRRFWERLRTGLRQTPTFQVSVAPREVNPPAPARDTDATEPRLFGERRGSK
jgi:hypothetical protein